MVNKFRQEIGYTIEVLNNAVLEGIQNFMIAALKIRKFDSVDSVEQVFEMRIAAEKDLRDLGCWFSYRVYVVVGRKAWNAI